MKNIGKWCKRLWVGLLAMVLLLGALPVSVFAAEEDTDILFQDDFSDATASAEKWTVSSGSGWNVTDGVYAQTGGDGAIVYAGDWSWTNYELETKVTPTGGNSYVMIYGRVQDDAKNSRYIVTFDGQASTLYVVRRDTVGSSSTDTKLKNTSGNETISYKLAIGTTYTVKVIFCQSTISVYVGGTLVFETTDSTYSAGKIGLATYSTQANFDDVTVRTYTEGLEVVTLPTTLSNYQVIQRNVTTQSAVVPISGWVTDDVASVEASVLKYGTETTVVDWTSMTVSNGAYTGSLTVPQGGWYQLAVRANDADGNELKSLTGEYRFGVGINILCAGQSNMVGQGAAPYTEANDLVANFRSGVWSHLVDPYDGAGASLVPAMANKLVEELGLPIGIIPAGDSGSGLHGPNTSMNHGEKWCWIYLNESNHADTSTLYGRALSRAQAAGGIELMVWNQGETDGMLLVPKDTYKADMVTLLNRFRTDLNNPDLPVFLCQIGTHDENISNDAAYTEIRSAQNELDDGENFFMAATEMELERKDTAHYTTPGMNIIGQRVANGILYYYGKSTYYRGPYIASADYADDTKTVVDVQITHRAGTDITPETGITGFTVVSGDQEVTVSSAEKLDADTVRLTLSEALTGDGYVRYLYGLYPANTNVVKDNTALALPMEATTCDIPIGEITGDDGGDEGDDEDPDPSVVDDISFTTADGDIVYPVDGLVTNDRYTVSGSSVTNTPVGIPYGTIPEGDTTCTYHAFSTNTIGDWVEFTLPVTTPGAYTVSVEGYGHSNRGTYQAYWNGKALGGAFSQKTSNTLDNQTVADRLVTHTVGTVTVEQAGEITVRFETTVAGPLGFCNIILSEFTDTISYTTTDGDTVYPADKLYTNNLYTVSGSSATHGSNATAHATMPEGATSVTYHAFSNLAVGDYVEFTLPVAQTGVYTLIVEGYGHSNRGTYQAYWNGEAIGDTFSQVTASSINNLEIADRVLTHNVGTVTVEQAGEVTVRFQSTVAGALGFCNIILSKFEDTISFTTDDGAIVYPAEKLVDNNEYAVNSTSVVVSENPTVHATLPEGSASCYYQAFKTSTVGDWVEFNLPVTRPGVYMLVAEGYGHSNRGTYQAYWNGTALGSTFTHKTTGLDTAGDVAARVLTHTVGMVAVEEAGMYTVKFSTTAGGYLAFCNVILQPVPVTVQFVGKYQEAIATKTVTSPDELVTALEDTAAPALGGYLFSGWDEDPALAWMLYQSACESDSQAMTVEAVYAVNEEKINTLTITGASGKDGLNNTVNSGDKLGFDTRVTVTADTAPAYWVLDGAKVGFAQTTYTFYVSGNNSIEAVYEAAETITTEVVLQQTKWSTNGEKYNLSVIAQTSIPTDVVYTDLSYGVYYTATEDAVKNLPTGGDYIQVKSSKTDPNQQYMTHLLNVAEGKIRFARAYMQYKVGDEIVTLFSDQYVKFETTAFADGEGNVTVTPYTVS